MRLVPLLMLLVAGACRTPADDLGSIPGVDRRAVTPRVDAEPTPRVLCVVAHPDDEIGFGGTLYQTAARLGGAVDIATITNGEGGYKYSTLAEPIYGLELTREDVGREHLPEIRARELVAGCRILRVRDIYFLGQQDHRYTTDESEVLDPDAGVWDLGHVRSSLDAILRQGDYDFVLTLVPTPETHGHHKAATILALEAIQGLAPEDRPVILCGRTRDLDGTPPAAFDGLAGYSSTRLAGSELVFDRTQGIGFRDRLSYTIVVNWAIAEHKSQGTMQLLAGRGDHEVYRLFALNPPDAGERAQAFFDSLEGSPFAVREYDVP